MAKATKGSKKRVNGSLLERGIKTLKDQQKIKEESTKEVLKSQINQLKQENKKLHEIIDLQRDNLTKKNSELEKLEQKIQKIEKRTTIQYSSNQLSKRNTVKSLRVNEQFIKSLSLLLSSIYRNFEKPGTVLLVGPHLKKSKTKQFNFRDETYYIRSKNGGVVLIRSTLYLRIGEKINPRFELLDSSKTDRRIKKINQFYHLAFNCSRDRLMESIYEYEKKRYLKKPNFYIQLRDDIHIYIQRAINNHFGTILNQQTLQTLIEITTKRQFLNTQYMRSRLPKTIDEMLKNISPSKKQLLLNAVFQFGADGLVVFQNIINWRQSAKLKNRRSIPVIDVRDHNNLN